MTRSSATRPGPGSQAVIPMGKIVTGQMGEIATENQSAIWMSVTVHSDEVYGYSPDLRAHCEHTGQAYILRVRTTFTLRRPALSDACDWAG